MKITIRHKIQHTLMEECSKNLLLKKELRQGGPLFTVFFNIGQKVTLRETVAYGNTDNDGKRIKIIGNMGTKNFKRDISMNQSTGTIEETMHCASYRKAHREDI